MSEICCGGSGGQSARRTASVTRAADMLALAASPTFAVMGLSSVLGGGPTEMICAAMHQSPWSGMASMYLLMGAFHLRPWLKVLRRS